MPVARARRRKAAQTKPARILVPVDGSRESNAAVHFVASRLTLDGAPRAQVELLNVQAVLAVPSSPPTKGAPRRAHLAREANAILAPAARALHKAGIETRTRCLAGSPGVVLGEVAAREADLVVMGSRGQTSIANLLLGSVSSTILATTDVPVLLVRKTGRFAPMSRRPLRIGIAVDGARDSRAAVMTLLERRVWFGGASDITLVVVVPDPLMTYVAGLSELPIPPFSAEQAAEIQQRAFEHAIGPARRLVRDAGLLALETCLVSNVPGDAIAAYAKKERLDLLVMGSHGHGALKSVVLGSVATRVAARCNTPLLVVRSARRSKRSGSG